MLKLAVVLTVAAMAMATVMALGQTPRTCVAPFSTDSSPCSRDSPAPNSPQPSVVRSPPPPPSSIPSPPIPSPPKEITASPPPPSIFVSMNPPPSNTPPPPGNDTLGGRNGAASSSLIGMARLVRSLLFGLIFVPI